MKLNKYYLFVLFILFFNNIFCQNNDSLFIDKLKKYFCNQIEYKLDGDLYSNWEKTDLPDYYLFVSYSNKIQFPDEYIYPENIDGLSNKIKIKQFYPFVRFINLDSAKIIESAYTQKGYSTYIYYAYQDSRALLNKKLINYSKASICFIVFHELSHNYLKQKSIKIPYEFEEALCDVIGNYLTLKYYNNTINSQINEAKKEIHNTEQIYKCLNITINKISIDSNKISIFNNTCQRKMNKLLKKSSDFQNDRFKYPVNNAFLLKNSNYCLNYFLLKKVIWKHDDMQSIITIIDNLPQTKSNCDEYLKLLIR
ncbi:MAG: hypothetical protein HY951_14395 [Bacteroidia bacterium]|nr:hypothetical protein [Bacteroidia bacterium]